MFPTWPVVVGENADGRLELFTGAAESYHMWQLPLNSGWSDWALLPGGVTPSAIATNDDGRLQVFGVKVDNNTLRTHIFSAIQDAPNSTWTNWQRLDEDDNNNWPGQPSVIMNSGRHLELFTLGTNQAVYHKWQQSVGGNWHDWTSMGGNLDTNVAGGRNLDGGMEIFALTINGKFYENREDSHGSWAGWIPMGAQSWQTIPGVGQNADGRLEIFIIGSDNALWGMWQTSPGNGWSDWYRYGGAWQSQVTPVVARNLDGRLQVFGCASDNTICTQYQLTHDNGWSNIQPLDSSGRTSLSNLAVGHNHDGRLEIFMQGTDGYIYHKWQLQPGSGWSDWVSLGTPTTI